METFQAERNQREIYGVSNKNDAIKVLLISYFLLRVTDLEIRQKLLALYTKYNRGSGIILNIGGGGGSAPGGGIVGISETFSRTISIDRSSLSGVGTFEEQIVEYLNNSNREKLGTDAEVWVEVNE